MNLPLIDGRQPFILECNGRFSVITYDVNPPLFLNAAGEWHQPNCDGDTIHRLKSRQEAEAFVMERVAKNHKGAEMKTDDHEVIEVQVKTSVCVTLRLKRGDAESMLLEELCRVLDGVLDDAKRTGSMVSKDREIFVEYDIGPNWDMVPEDDCELTSSEVGLFPDECDDD